MISNKLRGRMSPAVGSINHVNPPPQVNQATSAYSQKYFYWSTVYPWIDFEMFLLTFKAVDSL